MVKVENRRTMIGKYPDMSLADARKKAHGFKSETSTAPGTIKLERAVDLFLSTAP
jgi:hypothetical protein